MIDDALREHLEGPSPALLATANQGALAMTRAAGCIVEDERTIRISLLSTRAAWFLATLDAQRRVSVLFTRPDILRSFQLKGRLIEVVAATDADRSQSQRMFEAFTELVRQIDPRGRDFSLLDLRTDLAARVVVEQVFAQSPGPGAGALLRTAAGSRPEAPTRPLEPPARNIVDAPVLSLPTAFDGTVLVTADATGLPNIIHVSKVDILDDRHVVLSRQFFRKTAENLSRNPRALIHLSDHLTNRMYVLDVHHLRAVTSGPLFDRLAAEVDAIASLIGAVGIFRLEAADIFAVTGQHELPGFIREA